MNFVYYLLLLLIIVNPTSFLGSFQQFDDFLLHACCHCCAACSSQGCLQHRQAPQHRLGVGAQVHCTQEVPVNRRLAQRPGIREAAARGYPD